MDIKPIIKMSKLVEMPVQVRDLPAQNTYNMGENEVTAKGTNQL
jgi:hypothetical protein